MNSKHPTLPLDGILVVAMEQAVAAPLCTARLQKAGARVIKVERITGDFARNYDKAAAGESSYFTWTNQGKESLALDIKAKPDQALLRSILSKADIYVQNLAPGALGKLALDGQSLSTSHPKLITCNITGYGENESVAHLKAYDMLVQAESGLVSVSSDHESPGRIGISLCDIGAGVTAHAAILEALIKRGVTGRGTILNISLFDVAAEWMTVPFIHEAFGSGAPSNAGLSHPSISPYDAYETADGIKTLVSIQNEREWERFCEHVLGDSSVATDSRFSTNTNRVSNRKALNHVIRSIAESMDAAKFRDRLTKGDIAYGGINSVAEVCKHPALRLEKVMNSSGDAMNIPAHPYATRSDVQTRTPTIGEHTDSIREEFS